MKDNRICTRCVMDTSAKEISFDKKGVCNFCHYFDEYVGPVLERARTEAGKKAFHQMLETIKRAGKGSSYDSILGLSGGMDSSYLAYLAVESGLRPLAVHVDMGWNSEVSEYNVKNLVSKLGLDLETVVVDFEEMRDLQLAFYKAAVKNCEIPQDHAYRAALYQVAAKYDIYYLLLGGNKATESVLPKSWGYNAADLRHLLAIHRRFGSQRLRQYPTLGFWQRYLYYPFVRKIREVRLLDYIPYNKQEAAALLAQRFGWQDYGLKHYESVLTRFFQGYYLPTKFGIDKRKAHLSSLILSEQISREEALEELKKPPYPSEEQLQADKAHIAQRLGLSLSEWEEILVLPPRKHEEFPSSRFLFELKDAVISMLGIRKRRYGVR